MAQALASCGSLIHVCALRVTRLDSQGNVVATDNNSYVTNNVTSVEVDPDIEAGLDSTLVGGCDCIIASYKGTDKLKRFNFNLNLPTFEPALLEMMIGATLIEDTSDIPVPIGIGWPNQLSCERRGRVVGRPVDGRRSRPGVAVLPRDLPGVILADRTSGRTERFRAAATDRVHPHEHAVREPVR